MLTDLTTVTLCRDNPADLLLTLASVSEQTVRPGRVIVVDGSTTSFQEEMKEISERFGAVYLYQAPLGVYAAMNHALEHVNDDGFLHFLNSGDWFASPESLGFVEEALRDQPGLRWMVGVTTTIESGVARTNTRFKRIGIGFWTLRLFDYWFPHPSTFYDVATLRQMGGFNERLPIAADYLLSLRFVRRVGGPHILDRVISVHHLDGISSRGPISSAFQRSRARVWVFGMGQAVVEPLILMTRLFRQLTLRFRRASGPEGAINVSAKSLTRLGGIPHFCLRPAEVDWPDCCLDALRG